MSPQCMTSDLPEGSANFSEVVLSLPSISTSMSTDVMLTSSIMTHFTSQKIQRNELASLAPGYDQLESVHGHSADGHSSFSGCSTGNERVDAGIVVATREVVVVNVLDGVQHEHLPTTGCIGKNLQASKSEVVRQ